MKCPQITLIVGIVCIVASISAVVFMAFGGTTRDQALKALGIQKFGSASYESASTATTRRFLHIADLHADPFYDYKYYMVPALKISRSPKLYSNAVPAEDCGWQTADEILEHWNKTGGGPSCPCGQYGANPPFSVLQSLRKEIEKQKPEFILWGGDFASHYEPGTATGDKCRSARGAAKATVNMVTVPGVENMWGWGNNDVLPKRAPLEQSWLEEFGAHLLDQKWLKPAEMGTWNQGGFFRRNLGGGLCVVTLNSNSWTMNQINEKHNAAQLKWLGETAFKQDSACEKYFINAHVPLGWLESGTGHHQWDNLKGAEVPEQSSKYRDILAKHSKLIVAELYGHINKGDIRLMDPKKLDTTDAGNDDALGDIGEDVGGGDGSTVSFTVTGISRRANNDPQFQRVLLNTKTSAIKDIEVYAMEKGCAWDFSYSLKKLFAPHFNAGIDTKSLKGMVNDKSMVDKVESHLAMSSMVYDKNDLTDPAFLASVRKGVAGCEVKSKPTLR